MMTDKELQDALEALVDKSTIGDIVNALAVVCYEKAEHLRSNWQDMSAGKAWDGVGDRLDKVAQIAERA